MRVKHIHRTWRSSLGWSDFYFFDRTEDGTLPKKRYDFISPNPKFWLSRARQSFHFQKIAGGLNINIFMWKLAWSFLGGQKNFFLLFELFKQYTNVVFFGIFENILKKGTYYPQKTAKMAFLAVNTFLSAFSKISTIRTFGVNCF